MNNADSRYMYKDSSRIILLIEAYLVLDFKCFRLKIYSLSYPFNIEHDLALWALFTNSFLFEKKSFLSKMHDGSETVVLNTQLAVSPIV